MKRGPKIRTSDNSREGTEGIIKHEAFDAPCDLTPVAAKEYHRLVGVLQAKGTLDRVDLAVVAECSRVKALLDRAHKAVETNLDPKSMKIVGTLTTQRRGLLRELGLTLMPSRSMVRTNPVGSERGEDKSKWAGNLKIG